MTPPSPRAPGCRAGGLCQRVPAVFRHHPALGRCLRFDRCGCGVVDFQRSRWGYEIKLIGDNPNAARYAGLNITRNIVLVMMLSGALAGLAGMSEVSGVVHRLQERISPGYGFTGIIIAWLAKLNPFAVILVSILFGALIVAGREIQPSGLAQLLQGIILFMVISSDVLLRYKIRIIRTQTATA